jgi:hypothetical protein
MNEPLFSTDHLKEGAMNRTRLAAMTIAVAAAALLVVAIGCGSSTGDDAAATDRAGPSGAPPDMSGALTTALAGLVERGTITTAQRDAIVTKLASGFAGGPAQPQGTAGDGALASPPAQPQDDAGSRPDPSSMFSDALDELVGAGTITAAQAEAVHSALDELLPEPGGAPGAAPSATPGAAGEST